MELTYTRLVLIKKEKTYTRLVLEEVRTQWAARRNQQQLQRFVAPVFCHTLEVHVSLVINKN